MNLLCKLMLVLVCVVSAASASTRACTSSKDFDEIDLITGAVIEKQNSVSAVKKGQVSDLEELESGRRSGDELNDRDNSTSEYCLSKLTWKKWIWGGALVSFAGSAALIGCECGFKACDADGSLMMCAYILGGLGATFGILGCNVSSGEENESLLG